MGDGLGTILNPYPVAVSTAGVLAGKFITHISVGDAGVCAIDSDGELYCWGLNTMGQLGNGTFTTSLEPVVVSRSGIILTQMPSSISAGGTFGCSLTVDGRLGCWGDGNHGQLGNGKATTGASAYKSNVPVNVIQTGAGVMSGVTITQLSSGFAHTCVVSSLGRAYCWGLNDYGQLGNGVVTDTPTGIPVAVQDPPPVPPVLKDPDEVTATGTVGKAFTDTKAAEKVTGNSLRYAIKSGSLPAGLVINKLTGFITGTPTQSGTFTCVISASNAAGEVTITQTITINKQATATPSPTASTVTLESDISTSGTAKGMSLLPSGIIHARVTTQFAGSITGKITAIYRDQTSGTIKRFTCAVKPFGQFRANPKVKHSGVSFPSHNYVSNPGCKLPLAARQTIAKEKIQIIINLNFQRRWPTNYSKVTPNGRAITPWVYQVTVTAGKGKVVN